MHPAQSTVSSQELTDSLWRAQLERELLGNILPFWITHVVDPAGDGFHGALSNDLRVDRQSPRSAVLCARILWTYAAAQRRYPRPEYAQMARRAFTYLERRFWDTRYGGVYWQLDPRGLPLEARKHTYAQAFAIYGLSEYFQASGDPLSLHMALEVFELIDQHAHDQTYGGYIEGRAHDWLPMPDLRLSSKEPNCRKSMNTLLHVLEALASLLRTVERRAPEAGARQLPALRARLRELVEIFLDKIIDPQWAYSHLFFDDRWSVQRAPISYGHDIEASWLLVDAAATLGDAALLERAQAAALRMAEHVYERALTREGALLYEGTLERITDPHLHWWVQAEALVGFYSAYQLSGQPRYAAAARSVWAYIERHFVDRTHGEWFKIVDQRGQPLLSQTKTGPWECPYHHSRACLELLRRLG